MKKYTVGDELWVIPGFQHPHLLVIRCVIKEVEDWSEGGKIPGGLTFYWVDEPIGHSVDIGHEAYRSKQQAMTELRHRLGENKKRTTNKSRSSKSSLRAFRQRAKKFIRGTWKRAKVSRKMKFPIYKNKKKGIDWFTIVPKK